MRKGLIGATGFVGQTLLRHGAFARAYNSKTISEIKDEVFDLVICAGAPAAMWAANANPEADAANLDRLFESLRSAQITKLVLISTIAVFDDASAGYTEQRAQFESGKAYGRNRRRLEARLSEAFDCCVIRLPALFGKGLAKNFIFDLMNPAPSFIAPAKHEELTRMLHGSARAELDAAYEFNAGLAMWKLHRENYPAGMEAARRLNEVFEGVNFVARNFTNSESRFQYYNMERLSHDIEICLANGLDALNVSAQPLSANAIHESLFGARFDNSGPARVSENMHSVNGALFGKDGPYLYTREETLEALRAYVASELKP